MILWLAQEASQEFQLGKHSAKNYKTFENYLKIYIKFALKFLKFQILEKFEKKQYEIANF